MTHHAGRARRLLFLVGTVAALVLGTSGGALVAIMDGRAGAVAAAARCAPSGAGTTCTFSYNGTNGADGQPQTYTVPAGTTSVVVEAWGAQGGGASGGRGGHAKAAIAVTPGDVLTVRVGGQPAGASGGFNGGGNGAGVGAGGGGASDIRLGGDALAARVLVAGGGGGEGVYEDPSTGTTTLLAGGDGGGAAGAGGDPQFCSIATCAGGGTASAGGSGAPSTCGGFTGTESSTPGGDGTLGQGGTGGSVTCTGGFSFFRGPGGGGGRYGGGGGGTLVSTGRTEFLVGSPGGGGSGFVTPAASAPLDEAGVRSGHGLATITSNAPAVYSSSYRASEAPWLYTDAVFLHQPNVALVQRDATMFLAYLGRVIEANHSSPPVLGPNQAPGPLTVTTSYSTSEDRDIREAAMLFATDVPGLQRFGVQLLAFIVTLSR